MNCPKCGSTETIKFGFRMLKKGDPKRVQRYQCKKCGSIFYPKP